MKYRFQKLLQLHLQLFKLERIASPCLNTLLKTKDCDFRRCSLFSKNFWITKIEMEFPCLYINTLTSNSFNQVLGLFFFIKWREQIFLFWLTLNTGRPSWCISYRRSGSRGRVQGMRTPPWDDLRFSNTTSILPKKKKLCGLLVLK